MHRPKPSPHFASRLLRRLLDKNISDSALGDFEEQYAWIHQERGKFIAWIWYWVQIIQILPAFLSLTIRWRFSMFKNNVKTALRILARQKLFSLINIMGLAIGLTACMMIYIWIQDEISYGSFHQKSDRIFRVEQDYDQHEFSGRSAITSPGFGPALGRTSRLTPFLTPFLF